MSFEKYCHGSNSTGWMEQNETDPPRTDVIDTPHIDKAINRLTHQYEAACSDFDLAQALEEIREILNKLATSK